MILELYDSNYFNRREPVVKNSFLRRSARISKSKSKKNDEHVHHVDPVEGIFKKKYFLKILELTEIFNFRIIDFSTSLSIACH